MSSDGDAAPEIDPAWWKPALEADDLIEADWRPPEVTSRHLAQLARNAPESTVQRDVLVALAVASSAMLDPENWNEPFKPMWVMNGQRSELPTDLTEEQFQLLAKALPSIGHPLLRARVADVLWCFRDRSSSEWVGMAVDAYLAVPLDRDVWILVATTLGDAPSKSFGAVAEPRRNASAGFHRHSANAFSAARPAMDSCSPICPTCFVLPDR